MARRGHNAPPEQGYLFGAPPPPPDPPARPRLPAGARAVYHGESGEHVLSACERCGNAKVIVCGRELIEPGATRDLCASCVESTVRRRVAAGEPVPYGFEWVDCAPSA